MTDENNELKDPLDLMPGKTLYPVPAPTPSPMSIIEIAVSRDLDTEKLRELIALQREVKADEVKEAYNVAMAAFKADPPKIIKTKTAGFDHKSGGGRTEYSYADLSRAAEEINKALSVQGLSASWRVVQAEGLIKVTCIIVHALGHSESTTMEASPDQSGKKNPIQSVGSTVSYLQRYTLFAMVGLAAEGQDDDGVASEAEFINEGQAKILTKLVKEKYGDKSGTFFAELNEFIGVETIEEIPANKFGFVKAGLDKIKVKP